MAIVGKYYSYKSEDTRSRSLRLHGKEVLDKEVKEDQVFSPNLEILGYRTRT